MGAYMKNALATSADGARSTTFYTLLIGMTAPACGGYICTSGAEIMLAALHLHGENHGGCTTHNYNSPFAALHKAATAQIPSVRLQSRF
jgi:hypothetical protein